MKERDTAMLLGAVLFSLGIPLLLIFMCIKLGIK